MRKYAVTMLVIVSAALAGCGAPTSQPVPTPSQPVQPSQTPQAATPKLEVPLSPITVSRDLSGLPEDVKAWVNAMGAMKGVHTFTSSEKTYIMAAGGPALGKVEIKGAAGNSDKVEVTVAVEATRPTDAQNGASFADTVVIPRTAAKVVAVYEGGSLDRKEGEAIASGDAVVIDDIKVISKAEVQVKGKIKANDNLVRVRVEANNQSKGPSFVQLFQVAASAEEFAPFTATVQVNEGAPRIVNFRFLVPGANNAMVEKLIVPVDLGK